MFKVINDCPPVNLCSKMPNMACVVYSGPVLAFLGINPGDTMDAILVKISNKLLTL